MTHPETLFQFGQCDFVTAQNSSLDFNTTCTVKKKFQCTQCDFQTAYKNGLFRHVILHSGEKSFQCGECDYKTSQKRNLAQHARKHTVKNLLQCIECDFKTVYKESLSRHRRKHLHGELFQCTDCDFKTVYKRNLSEHSRTHISKRFQCSECDFKTEAKWRLSVHKIIHGKNILKSADCDFKTAQMVNLITPERRQANETSSYSKKCSKTDQGNSLVIQELRHVVTNGNETGNEVSEESEYTTDRVILNDKLHEETDPIVLQTVIHSDNGLSEVTDYMVAEVSQQDRISERADYLAMEASQDENIFDKTDYIEVEVDQDDAKVSQGVDNIVETIIYSDNKPSEEADNADKLPQSVDKVSFRSPSCGARFQCDQCSFKTSYKYRLINHELKHTGEMMFLCGLCDYKAVRKFSVLSHYRTHTGEKPFSCNHCEYKSAQKNLLAVHKTKNHFGEQPFTCEHCDFKTDYVVELSKHKLTHDLKEFHCDECNFQTNHKTALSNHKKTHIYFIDYPLQCDKNYLNSSSPANGGKYSDIFQCEKCSFRTKYVWHLVNHKLKHRILEKEEFTYKDEKVIYCNKVSSCVEEEKSQREIVSKTIQSEKKLPEISDSVAEGISQRDKTSEESRYIVEKADQNHNKVSNNESSKITKFQCVQCKHITNSEFCMILHTMKHTGETIFHCRICDYKITGRKSISKHLKSHKRKKLNCNQCEYKSTKNYDLILHKIETHSDEKPFNCKRCDFKTDYSNILASHELAHDDGKEFHCNHCSFATNCINALFKHKTMNTHFGKPPYYRKKINFKSSIPSNALKYTKICLLPRYVCGKCNFSAAYKSLLVEHQMTHASLPSDTIEYTETNLTVESEISHLNVNSQT